MPSTSGQIVQSQVCVNAFVTLCAVALLLAILSGDAMAQPIHNALELSQAKKAYSHGDCARAWDIAWPLAKMGDHEARYFLYGTIVDRMIPPGDTGFPKSTFIRHNLTLAAYAALATNRTQGGGSPTHQWVRTEIPKSIDALDLGARGDRVAQCYRSASSFHGCLSLALSLGIIQEFRDYAREVEAAARETGLSARCRAHPW